MFHRWSPGAYAIRTMFVGTVVSGIAGEVHRGISYTLIGAPGRIMPMNGGYVTSVMDLVVVSPTLLSAAKNIEDRLESWPNAR